MNIQIQDIAAAWLAVFEPPPRMTVSEWANEYRFLSPESSGQHGKYSSDLTPYAEAWMDSINDPGATGTVLMVGAQLGKTEVLNNVIGYFIDVEPAAMLMVQPTADLGESWSKERLAPMVRDTPRLNGKVADVRSRDSSNTMLFKSFPGGNLAIAGANAPSGLASRPRRVVLLDEVDRYPVSAGSEGDPCALAIRRTETFWNAVIVMTSTPTVKGRSRVETEFEGSDQQRYFCPCPRCGHKQTLKWINVRWDRDDGSDAYLFCEGCEAHLSDDERREMVRAGEWVAQYPERTLRGFHLPGIASMFRHKRGFKSRLHQMAAENIKAKRRPETLRTWINTFLAETWEEEGESVQWEPLLARREDWGDFPKGGLILTAGVDIQGDRFEIEVVAWGEGEESWSIYHVSMMGDFNNVETQNSLDEILAMTWIHPSGAELGISCTFIDSGHKTKAVYAYTKSREVRRVYAIKGQGGPGIPIVGRPTRRGNERAALFSIGTDTAKELIYSRLSLGKKGAGFMHFPHDRPEDWFRQLTVEVKVIRYRNGIPYARFENPSKARNEALDLRVYASAALALLRVNWKKLKRSIAPDDEAEPEVKKKKRERRGGGAGWVNSW
jgi:phage terminase large subunit GpA-like protein